MKHFYRTRDRPAKPYTNHFNGKERKLEKHYQKSGRCFGDDESDDEDFSDEEAEDEGFGMSM